jgi:hypothetical protein
MKLDYHDRADISRSIYPPKIGAKTWPQNHASCEFKKPIMQLTFFSPTKKSRWERLQIANVVARGCVTWVLGFGGLQPLRPMVLPHVDLEHGCSPCQSGYMSCGTKVGRGETFTNLGPLASHDRSESFWALGDFVNQIDIHQEMVNLIPRWSKGSIVIPYFLELNKMWRPSFFFIILQIMLLREMCCSG